MKFKLLAIAAASAALLSTNAHAQESFDYDDAYDFVEELVEEVMSDPWNNWGDNGSDIDLDATVLSAAINVNNVYGNVEMDGRDVTISGGAATVSATATATATDSVAKATAITGTDITTLAAGAINSSNVDVSGYQVGEDYVDTVNGDEGSYREIDVPYTAVFHAAVNTGEINASVHIHAMPAEGIYHTTGGTLALSNLAISTTALGAVNSGTVRIGADLIEAAKLAVAQ